MARRPKQTRRCIQYTHLLYLLLTAAGAATAVGARPPAGSSAAVELTSAEREWLAQHPVIRLAPDPDFPPIEFFGEDGHYRGMAAEYLALIESRLGIRVQVVRKESWDEVLAAAADRQVDLLAAAMMSPQRRQYLLESKPHIRLPGVIINSSSGPDQLSLPDLRGKRVAVVSNYVWQDLISNDFPDITLVPVPDISTALRRASFGTVDAMVGDPATASHYIEKQGITNLKIAGDSGYHYELAFLCRSDWPELVDIINKTLATITAEERLAISRKWTNLAESEFLLSNHLKLGLGAVATAIACVLVWNRSLKRQVASRTAQLNQVNDSLEQLVRNRTTELAATNDELRAEISERRKFEQQLHRLAMHDALTGLANQTQFKKTLEQAIQRAKGNSQRRFAVLFLDFDRFKIVNDSLGHKAGDMLLVEFARRIRENLEDFCKADPRAPSGLPARIGGDEFVILLEDVTQSTSVETFAENLQVVLSTSFELEGNTVTSSASIGIVYCDDSYDSAEQVMRDADLAMYQAKRSGKAQHAVFNVRMHEEALEQLHLEKDLRRALEDNALVLHYQPLVDLSSGTLTGFEALIRWNHPERGLLSPGYFLDLAEEIGLIVPMGAWVLEQACAQLNEWRQRFPQSPSLSMNINVSARQLSDKSLLPLVRDTVSDAGIDPHALKLEITESVMMNAIDEVAPILQALRDLGVHLCMDDFGTGYSSLSRLHRLPVNVLKIDRAFIASMEEAVQYTAVVQAMVTLAHTLDMKVVAEGIETANQLVQLQALDCDQAQGYYFGRPAPAKQAEVYLRDRDQLLKSA